MTSTDKWNFIVSQYHELRNKPESFVQSAWESYCSELFDYKKLLGEINSQPSVHIGSSQKVIPDIFLKIDDKDVLDIELKKYSLSFDSSFQEQLISYLKLTNICVGMIVCNEIRVYYYDYSKNKTEFTSVSFTKDNPDGIQLVELIEKENFSNEKIKKFIEEKNEKAETILSIRNSLTPDLIRTAVADYLCKDYPQELVDEALKNINFNYSHFSVNPKAPVSVPVVGGTPEIDEKGEMILQCAKKWISEKHNSGIVNWDIEQTKKSYIRFTTEAMDKIIPTADHEISGWGNNRFYYYEIHICYAKKNFFQFQLAFNRYSRKNKAPANVEEALNNIFKKTGKYPKNSNWQWYVRTEPRVHFNSVNSEEEIFKALEEQFNSLMLKEQEIIKAVTQQ